MKGLCWLPEKGKRKSAPKNLKKLFDRIVAGLEKKNRILNEKEKKTVE